MTFLGIDIGCTSIKHGRVNINHEIDVADFDLYIVPQASRTQKYIKALNHLTRNARAFEAIGVGFPSVVWGDWILNTAIQFNEIWEGLSKTLQAQGVRCFALNDADAAGLAEIYRHQASELRKGVTIVITLGTGIGSAVFCDGKLMPNTEFGVVELHGLPAEKYTAPSIKNRDSISMQDWASRLNEYLCMVDILLAPDHIVIGGGISANFEEYRQQLHTRHAVILPAYYRNQAGVIGAAMYAAQQTDHPVLVDQPITSFSL